MANQPVAIHTPHSPPNEVPDLIPDTDMSPPFDSPFQAFARLPRSQPKPSTIAHSPWPSQPSQPGQYANHPIPLSIAPSASTLSPVAGYQLSNSNRPSFQASAAGREVGFTNHDELFAQATTADFGFQATSPKRPIQQPWTAGLASPQEEVRNTVSPQEAFLDYDDQSHRLQDAGLGAQSSLFAPLAASHSPSSSLAPIPVSFSPPSARSSFSSQDRYSVSPGSGHRLRPSSSPVSGWLQPAPARKSHPFSVPQNAVSWNSQYDQEYEHHNEYDELEETPLATAFDMDPFPNLELEPIPVMGQPESADRHQNEFIRSLQAEHNHGAKNYFGRTILLGAVQPAPGSPAPKAEPAPPATAATEWTASHPRRPAAQNAIALLQQRLSDSDPFGDEDEDAGKKVIRRRKPKKDTSPEDEADGGEYTPTKKSSRHHSPEHPTIAPLPALPDDSLSASRKRSPPAAFDEEDSLSSLPDEDDDHDRDGDFSDRDAEHELDPDHHPDEDDDDGSSPRTSLSRRRSHKASHPHTLQPNKRRRRIPVAQHGQLPPGSLRCTLPAVAEDGAGLGTCGVVFKRPYDLARHKETIHGVALEGKAPRKTDWKCEECDGSFSRKDALIRHARIRGHDAGIQ